MVSLAVPALSFLFNQAKYCDLDRQILFTARNEIFRNFDDLVNVTSATALMRPQGPTLIFKEIADFMMPPKESTAKTQNNDFAAEGSRANVDPQAHYCGHSRERRRNTSAGTRGGNL
jgi:hypothetical protein